MMSSIRIVLFAAIAAAGLTAAGTASASSIELNIDFRDPTIWHGYGEASDSSGKVTVDGNGGLLYRDNKDGFGILGGEYDEIDAAEVLTVWFADGYFDNVSNLLTGVLLTDLFTAPGALSGEAGWITLFFGDATLQFFVQALERVANGEYYLDFGGAYAPDRIVFTAYNGNDIHYNSSEYSVAGFTTVPEPAALFLMGVGLLMLGLQRRRATARVR